MSTIFWEQVTQLKTTDCWPWNGEHDEDGRPLFNGGKAYRTAYQLRNGDLESGNHVHHKCENSSCVNPRHLVQLAPQEHIAAHQALRSGKTETVIEQEEERHTAEIRKLANELRQRNKFQMEQKNLRYRYGTVEWNNQMREQVKEKISREEAEYRAWQMRECSI